jgi:hypothetical protein
MINLGNVTPRPRRDARKWNGWRYNRGVLSYRPFPNRAYVYAVDVGTLTLAGMLSLIMQVSHKTWATDECLAGFVRALDHILNPQAMCASM